MKGQEVLGDSEQRMRMAAKATQVFSPSAPIDEAKLFAGRLEQVREVINAVAQRGQHAIIYGERGVGKTSLANVLSNFLPDMGVGSLSPAIVNCDGTTDFSSLWHQIAREVSLLGEKTPLGFNSAPVPIQTSLDSLLPADITPDDARFLFDRVVAPAIIIIDEMDRLGDETTTALLADTVKTLSDHSIEVTLILVGVADSVDDLIAKHESIERALVQIRMPRMSNEELDEIIDKGLSELEMSIDKDAKQRVILLSQGLPHFTHLLGLFASQQSINAGRTNVTKADVASAIEEAVEKTQQSIVHAHHAATSSPRDTLSPQVLLACALAEKDQLGQFSAADVRGPMSRIMGKRYDIPAFSRHLNLFTENERGPVLQKSGQKKRFRYRFLNPMMEPFVTMTGLAQEMITEKRLNDPTEA